MAESEPTPTDVETYDQDSDRQLSPEELRTAAEVELASGNIERYRAMLEQAAEQERLDQEEQARIEGEQQELQEQEASRNAEEREAINRARADAGEEISLEEEEEGKKKEWKGSAGDYFAAGVVATAAGTGAAAGKVSKGIFGRISKWWNSDKMKERRSSWGWLGGAYVDSTVGLLKKDIGKPEHEHEGIQEAKKKKDKKK